MRLEKVLAAGLVLVGLTGCMRQVTEIKAVHVADPPRLGPGTGADDDPIEIGKDVTAPVIIYGPEAEFSDKARRKKEECTVNINVTVTKEGGVRDVLLIDSCPDLDANALRTVKTYRFKPAMKNGQPVAVHVMIEVGFRIY